MIVFTSDHGEFLGDHSLMLKGALPYRSITRVPFIWSDLADRFTLYKEQPFGELYDLRCDPLEQHNRFDDPDYAGKKAELMTQLAQEMMCNMETSPRSIRRA